MWLRLGRKKTGRGWVDTERRERREKQGKFVCRRKEMIFGGEEDGSLEPALYPKNGHNNVKKKKSYFISKIFYTTQFNF